MQELTKGANAPVTAADVRLVLEWTAGSGSADVDLSALLCHASGKVGTDADFVFFNQPDHPSGAVLHRGGGTGGGRRSDTLEISLLAVPAQVETIVVAASADRPFGQVPDLALTIADVGTGQPLLRFPVDASTETALVAGELYRRAGSWKFRAVGQGYDDGLAGLARDYGISVDDPAPPAPPAPAAASPAPASPSHRPPDPRPGPRAGAIDWMNPPVPAGYEI